MSIPSSLPHGAHGNLIGGVEQAALEGTTFPGPSCPSPVGDGSTAAEASRVTWPRSGAMDVQRALASLQPGARAWAQVGEASRRAVLTQAWEAMGGDPDPEDFLARRLGLDGDECRRLLVGQDRAAQISSPEVPGSGAVVLVRAHWSELLGGLFRRVAAELAAGHGVLLLSDGRVPELGERLGRALLAAGLPPDALALLHDDGDTALRMSLKRQELGGCLVSDTRPEPRDLGASEDAVAGQPFGEGVLARTPTLLQHHRLERGTTCVAADEDPAAAACRVARAAFGRVEALSGQLPGALGVVDVAPRVLSAFTASLLEALEVESFSEDLGLAPPCPWVQPDLSAYLDETVSVGTDGGATLIHEGRRSSFPGERGGGTITRLVFTNVEADMRLFDRRRPAPVLLLRRQERAPTSVQNAP